MPRDPEVAVTQDAKREGPGRPPLPDDERRDTIVRIRLTSGEYALLAEIAANDTSTRDVLLAGVAALRRKRR